MAELMVDLAEHYEPDDPRRLWMVWLSENHGRWDEACQEIGAELPDHGPGYYGRLRELVQPILAVHHDR